MSDPAEAESPVPPLLRDAAPRRKRRRLSRRPGSGRGSRARWPAARPGPSAGPTAGPKTSGKASSAPGEAASLTWSRGLLASNSADQRAQNAASSKSVGRSKGSGSTRAADTRPARNTRVSLPSATRYQVPALFTRPSGPTTRGSRSAGGYLMASMRPSRSAWARSRRHGTSSWPPNHRGMSRCTSASAARPEVTRICRCAVVRAPASPRSRSTAWHAQDKQGLGLIWPQSAEREPVAVHQPAAAARSRLGDDRDTRGAERFQVPVDRPDANPQLGGERPRGRHAPCLEQQGQREQAIGAHEQRLDAIADTRCQR